jgi:autotransporter-associated beta strand protein
MPRSRRSTYRLLFAAAGMSLANVASATTYTDTITTDHFGGPEVDVSNVVVTNDAFNLYVTINMNPAANLTSAAFGSYEMGIQVGNGAGGQTAINNNFNLGDPTGGNPYGSEVGISTGENFFIGSELPGGSNSTGGATLYGYSTTGGWSNLYTSYTDPTRFTSTATSLTFNFPLTSFGFSSGTKFNFDVWTTFTANPGGQGAYDALDNNGQPDGSTATPWTGVPYDSATATGSTLSTYTVVSASLAANWNIDGGGSWNNAASWDVGVPNAPGSTATFGSILDSAGTPPAIVTVDASQTVGQITFNNTNKYSITTTSGSSLTINDTGDSAGVNPSISALSGSHSIAVPIFLNAGVTLNASASSSLSISGDLPTDGISGTGPVTVTGAGSVTLSGTNNYTGNTTVNSGATLNIGNTSLAGALPTTTTLISNGNTSFSANPGTGILVRSLAGITLSSTGKVVVAAPIAANHANRSVLVTTSLAFGGSNNAWQGLLDLTSNDMIVSGGGATALTNITNQIKQGYNAGTWTGTGGITTSVAIPLTGLGVELNNNGSGGTLFTSFDGQTVTNTDVLVKYTYHGDANLDGVINGTDYTLIDNGFNSQSTANPLSGWRNGDFNYDGKINGDDYSMIDNAFNMQGASLAAVPAEPAEIFASSSNSIAAVPEPATLGLLGISAAQLLLRRRRRI